MKIKSLLVSASHVCWILSLLILIFTISAPINFYENGEAWIAVKIALTLILISISFKYFSSRITKAEGRLLTTPIKRRWVLK